MKLTFVRHGQTEANKTKILQHQLKGKLTKKGKIESKKLAKRLSKEEFDIIYCSDSERTKETAKAIISQHKSVPIRYTKELREICRGKNECLPGKELWALFIKSGKSFTEFKPEGGKASQI